MVNMYDTMNDASKYKEDQISTPLRRLSRCNKTQFTYIELLSVQTRAVTHDCTILFLRFLWDISHLSAPF